MAVTIMFYTPITAATINVIHASCFNVVAVRCILKHSERVIPFDIFAFRTLS